MTLRLLGALTIMAALSGAAAAGRAATPAPLTASVALPATNVAGGASAVASDDWLVYTLPTPLLQPSTSDANHPFTAFHQRVYAVALRVRGQRLLASSPRFLFTAPSGLVLSPGSVSGGWLIYTQYSSLGIGGPWTLIARQITTGRSVVLDSPVREGLPSGAAVASSDGHTVVWQSWTALRGQRVSVIRAYNLATGQRRLVAHGGSESSWSYLWPSVSGRQVVFARVLAAQPLRAQMLLANLTTGAVRALTPLTAGITSPVISGDLVAWKGRLGPQEKEGGRVVVANLRTGAQRSLNGSFIEFPQVVAGRYVVFPIGLTPHLALYDSRAGTTTRLAQPGPLGAPGNSVQAAEHTVLYSLGRFSATTTPLPSRLVVVRLP